MMKRILFATIIGITLQAEIRYDHDAKVLWKTAEDGFVKDWRESMIMDACYYMAKAYSEGKSLQEAIDIGTGWLGSSRDFTPEELDDIEKLCRD